MIRKNFSVFNLYHTIPVSLISPPTPSASVARREKNLDIDFTATPRGPHVQQFPSAVKQTNTRRETRLSKMSLKTKSCCSLYVVIVFFSVKFISKPNVPQRVDIGIQECVLTIGRL